jgi:hypothetical protein
MVIQRIEKTWQIAVHRHHLSIKFDAKIRRAMDFMDAMNEAIPSILFISFYGFFLIPAGSGLGIPSAAAAVAQG